MKQFNPDFFINYLNNCEVLNGSLYDQDISWDKWKAKFNEICNKHAPIKVARLNKRSNPWITPDVVKLMYKRDHVHAKAVRTKNDILFGQYRSLRNYVAKIIKENKQKYYNEINSLRASDPKKKCGRKLKSWFQINLDRTQSTVIFLLVALINISLILPRTWMINCKMKPCAFLWKCPRSCYEFKFQHISYMDIQCYFDSLANKHWNNILDMDVKLLKLASPVISKSLESVVNSSLENGIVHDDWKKARVTLV